MNSIKCKFILRYFFILINLIFFVNSNAEAAGELAQTFTLDGQLNQVGTEEPLLDANVKIVVQILNPAKTCLLYEEEQTVNTTNSKGNYTIQVGSLTSAGKRTASDPGRTMVQIFQNSVPIAAANAPGQSCAGALYTPASADSRNFRIIVTPSSTNIADTLQPDTVMDSVSMALVAQTLQGYVPGHFLQIGTGDLTQANVQTVFGTGNTAKLTSLLSNNPTDYVLKNSTNGTIQLPAASAPTSPSTGAIWYDGGAIKFWNGTSEQALGVAGSGITNITAGTGLNVGAGPGGSITSTGTLNVDVGTAVGKIVQVQAGGKLPALSAADLTAVNGSAITSGTIGGSTAISTSGRIETSSSMRLYDGGPTNYVGLQAPTSVTTSYSLTWPSAVPGVAGSLLTSNTSGGLSWTAPSSLSPWVTAGSDIYYTTGNVGIGTATPAEKLDISGNINFSGVGSAVIRRDNDTSPLDIYGGPTYSQGAKLSLYGENEAGNPGRAVVAYGGGTVGSLAQTNGYFQVFRRNSAGTQSVLLADMQGRIGIGTITPTVSLDIGSKTDAVRLPVGTTAQQPASPATGMIRWNSDNTAMEYYNGTGWVNVTSSGTTSFSNVNTITGGASGLAISAGGTNQDISLTASGTGTVTTGSPMTITNTTASTGSNNGALVVSGGVGVSGALNTGGNIASSASISAATSMYTPIIYGGSTSGGNVTLDSTSHATKGNVLIAPNGGNVGIGTSAPSSSLHLAGSSTTELTALTLENTGAATLNALTSLYFKNANGLGSEAKISAVQDNVTAGSRSTSLAFYTEYQASGAQYGERMRISGQGKVGIGTASPISPLHVYDTASATYSSITAPTSITLFQKVNSVGTSGQYASIGLLASANGGPNAASAYLTAIQTSNNSAATDLAFTLRDTGGPYSEKMRISAAGNVSVTSGYVTATGYKDTAGNAMLAPETSNGNTRITAALNSGIITFVNGSGEKMRLDGSGNVGISTDTPSVSLDVRTTDAIRMPAGTTAQQPASPAAGMIRWNSDNTAAEIFNGTGWVSLGTYSGAGTYSNVNVISGGSSGLSISAGGTNQNLTLSSSGTGTVTTGSPVTITNATASTASNNGALVVTGGVGISGALNTGGNIYSSGNITAATALYSPIIYGGTASSGDLTLDSTSHATKGNVYIAPSGGKVGIGTTSPNTLLDIRPNVEGSTGVGFVNIQTSEGGTFFTAHQTGSGYSYSDGMFKAITDNPTGANNVYFQGVTDNVTKFSVQADGQGYFAGKVGIGTAVPASTLDLNGDLSSRGMAAPALSVVGTGKIYFDSTANKFKVSQNGGAFADLVGGGGTVTDVTGSGAISSSGGATPAISIADSSYGTKGALSILTDATTSGLTIASGVLSINTGTAANQIVKLDGTGKLPSVDGSTLTNLTAANISSGTLPIARGGTNSSTALTNGKVMVSTGGAIVEGMASSTASSANTFVIRDGSGNINAAIGTFSGVNVNAGSNLTLNGSTSGSVVVASPDAPTSYTFTLPTDAGTSGQVLSTNGSGITSWVSAVTSTTGFINGGNSFGSAATFGTNDNFDLDIKTNNTSKVTIKSSGNVGIGTTTPGAKLHVVGSGSAAFPAVSGSTQSGLAARLQGAANNAILDIGGNTTNGAWLQSTNKNDLSANYPLLLNPNGGNIGIGTTSPGSGTKLNVAGQIVSGSASIATGVIDFSSGNAITTTDDCASPLTLANIQDGGSYTVVVTGTGTAQCSFSTTTTGDGVGTVTYRFNPSNTTRTASSHTVYSMMRVGSIVYVSWITGF